MQQIQNLIANPAFEMLRQQAQSNPQILPQLLKLLQDNYPTLYQLFSQNPQLLVALLSGNPEMMESGVDESQNVDNSFQSNAPQTVDLTESDQLAIKQLMDFGFNEQQCIEAYLVCNKNIDLAMNYLLDGGN